MKIERIVITGGRSFADADRIEADLRALLPLGLRRVAQGGNGIDRQCGGAETPKKFESADTLAWLATHALHLEEATYWVNMTPTDGALGDAHIPQWTGADGKWPAAGNRRNVRMLEAEKPDLVLAYPDPLSRGTWNCVREAIKRNIPVILWHDGVMVTTAQMDATWTVIHSSVPAEHDKRAGLLAPPRPGAPLDRHGEDMPTLLAVLGDLAHVAGG